MMRTKASTSSELACSPKGATRRVLKAAGRKAEEGVGRTTCHNPAAPCWYDELRALAPLLKEGVDSGDSA